MILVTQNNYIETVLEQSDMASYYGFYFIAKPSYSCEAMQPSDVQSDTLGDAQLLIACQQSIEPLLAEDWNSPEDDIWDSI